MSQAFTESIVEQAALARLEALDCAIAQGPEIVESERRGDYGSVMREDRHCGALRRLNPKVSAHGCVYCYAVRDGNWPWAASANTSPNPSFCSRRPRAQLMLVGTD